MSEKLKPCEAIYDKRGLPIQIGDVLKVFHFIGARRKRHYMYKQVTRIERLGDSPHYYVNHLELNDNGYWLPLNGASLEDYEIVQGVEAFWESRPPHQRS